MRRARRFQAGKSALELPRSGTPGQNTSCSRAKPRQLLLKRSQPISGQIEASFPQIRAVPLTFSQGGYPHMEELCSSFVSTTFGEPHVSPFFEKRPGRCRPPYGGRRRPDHGGG